ncbi:hypothetical protein MMC21_001309 [Puttea exsequens]|nr:hypothetical protein [Puttea exsequens]
MDEKTRNKYETFLEEDWAKLGYLATPGSNEHGLGLTNTKHPIFQYTNLSRPDISQPIWVQYTLDEYDLLCAEIDPILRLASLMLESPASLDFLHDVIYSPRQEPEELVEYNGYSVLELKRAPPSDSQRTKTKEALYKLAESIVFLVESPDHREKDAHCNTTPSLAVQAYGTNIADDAANLPKGIGSIIRINKSYLVSLTALLAQEENTTSQILSLQFKVATLLCHEVAHAVGHAANLALLHDSMVESTLQNLAKMERAPREKERVVGANEPFYGTDSVAELGYCWESAVLGGTVQWAHQVEHPLFFSKWPSFLADGDFPRRAGYRNTATQYVVPMHYLRNLHRQDFWEKITPGDTTALYIKKHFGIRVTNQDTAPFDAIGFPSIINEEDEHRETPDLFRAAREGEPDPSASRANETLLGRVERISGNSRSLQLGKLHIAHQVRGKKMGKKRAGEARLERASMVESGASTGGSARRSVADSVYSVYEDKW